MFQSDTIFTRVETCLHLCYCKPLWVKPSAKLHMVSAFHSTGLSLTKTTKKNHLARIIKHITWGSSHPVVVVANPYS